LAIAVHGLVACFLPLITGQVGHERGNFKRHLSRSAMLPTGFAFSISSLSSHGSSFHAAAKRQRDDLVGGWIRIGTACTAGRARTALPSLGLIRFGIPWRAIAVRHEVRVFS